MIGEKESRIVKACYLGKQKLEVISDVDVEQTEEQDEEEVVSSEVTLLDVVPIPLLNNNNAAGFSFFSSNGVLERDKGLFDNLPYDVWSNSKMTKKMLYDTCLALGRSKGSDNNVYTTFLEAVEKVLDAQVTGLLLEIKEVIDKGVNLGGAVVVAKRSVSDKHRLSASSSLRGADPNETAVCNIHLDELVYLSQATNMPIWMDKKLYLSVCVDALLTQTSSSGIVITSIPSRLSNNKGEKRRSKPTRDYPKAWEIKDPDVFLQLSTSEKRNILRLSGVLELPRPREGKQALDAMLLDLCDAAVRSEVNRRMSNKDKESSGLGGIEGGDGRAALLQQIASALEANDASLASKLRAEFDLKTSLRADPTQQVGSYDRYLDQDEWYMQQRRMAMAPKKNK